MIRKSIYGGVITVVGILAPMFQSYKAVSQNHDHNCKFWLKYWIVLGLYLSVEPVVDSLLEWLPLYYELKTAGVLWFVSGGCQGASFLYQGIVEPLLTKHEVQMDMALRLGAEWAACVGAAGRAWGGGPCAPPAASLLYGLLLYAEQAATIATSIHSDEEEMEEGDDDFVDLWDDNIVNTQLEEGSDGFHDDLQNIEPAETSNCQRLPARRQSPFPSRGCQLLNLPDTEDITEKD